MGNWRTDRSWTSSTGVRSLKRLASIRNHSDRQTASAPTNRIDEIVILRLAALVGDKKNSHLQSVIRDSVNVGMRAPDTA